MTIDKRILRDQMLDRIVSDADRLSYHSLWSAVRCVVRGDFDGLTYEEGECEPGLAQELLRRLKLYRKLEGDPAAQRQELERCLNDRIAFFDDYYWQPNVKERKVLPFVLFDRQREAVEWMHDLYTRQEPGLFKKSREFGGSCLTMGFITPSFVAEPHFSAGVASRKQQYLYVRKNWHSILEKFVFGLQHLPPWMRGNFRRDKHVSNNKILNPDNGALVMGEVGEYIGSGGRASIYIVDELSLVERQAEAWQSLAGTADCIIGVYTSKGPGTYVHQELESNPNISLMVTPWYHDPRKVDDLKHLGDPEHWSEWAQWKLERTNPYTFELEFCCNDEVPDADGICSPAWMSAAKRIEVAKAGLPVAGIDLSDGGEDEHVLAVRWGAHLELFTWSNLELEEAAPLICDKLTELGVKVAFFDNLGRGSNFPKTQAAIDCDCRFVPVSSNADAGLRRLRDSDEIARNRFANKTTELWWCMCQALRASWEKLEQDKPLAESVCLRIDDAVLERQIMARKYEIQKQGIKLESKRRMRKSPDRADAVSFTYERDPRVTQDASPNAIAPQSKQRSVSSIYSTTSKRGSPWR